MEPYRSKEAMTMAKAIKLNRKAENENSSRSSARGREAVL